MKARDLVGETKRVLTGIWFLIKLDQNARREYYGWSDEPNGVLTPLKDEFGDDLP